LADAPLDPEDMTPEQLAEAKDYQRQSLYCDLADRAVDLLYLTLMAFLLVPLFNGLLEWIGIESAFWRLGGLYLIIYALHAAASFPIVYYSGFTLEHQYGLSNETRRHWLWQYAKRNLLAVGLGIFMWYGVFLLIWNLGAFWWIAAALGFFAMSMLLGQLAPVVIFPLFHAIEPLEDEDLGQRFMELADGTGLSIEGVYRMDMSTETVKANAMLAGLGNTRRVILGDTLLDGFEKDEIETVIAHEIGHHVHKHIWKLMLFGLVYSTVGFFLVDRVLLLWEGGYQPAFSYRHDVGVASLPLIMLAITLFSQLLEPLQNWFSRRFEREADRYAVERTLKHAAYRSAMKKLARLNKADPMPHPVEVFLFHSHPPIEERVAAIGDG